ncbi:MAG: hypothetical protein NZ730_06630 [Porticoccaceae bacterium]|nr:hypothetical protein [Porticoccaceae bacterium]
MNIKPLGGYMTQVGFKGNQILFSYETPVAAWDSERGEYIKTDKFWSVTTCKHIAKWFDGSACLAREVDQSELDAMVK